MGKVGGEPKGTGKGGKGWKQQNQQNQNMNTANRNMNWNTNWNAPNNTGTGSGNNNQNDSWDTLRQPRVMSDAVEWTCVECWTVHRDAQCNTCGNQDCRMPRSIFDSPTPTTLADYWGTAKNPDSKGKSKGGV